MRCSNQSLFSGLFTLQLPRSSHCKEALWKQWGRSEQWTQMEALAQQISAFKVSCIYLPLGQFICLFIKHFCFRTASTVHWIQNKMYLFQSKLFFKSSIVPFLESAQIINYDTLDTKCIGEYVYLGGPNLKKALTHGYWDISLHKGRIFGQQRRAGAKKQQRSHQSGSPS